MTEFDSELEKDPIIGAAMERERAARGWMKLAMGILVGNMLFVLFMGWMPSLVDPDAALPYGPIAVNVLAVAIHLVGLFRSARAKRAIVARCEELLQQHFEGNP
jgi:hypothetical protein